MSVRMDQDVRDDSRPLIWGLVLSLFFHVGILAVPLGAGLLGLPTGVGNGGVVRVSIVELPADGADKADKAAGSGKVQKPAVRTDKSRELSRPAAAKPAPTTVVRQGAPPKKLAPAPTAAKPAAKPAVPVQPAGKVLTTNAAKSQVAVAAEPRTGEDTLPPQPEVASATESGGGGPGAGGKGGSGQGVGGAGTGGLPLGEGMLLGIVAPVGVPKEANGLPAQARTIVFRVTVSPDGSVKSLADVQVETPRLSGRRDEWAAANVARDIQQWIFAKVRFKPFGSTYVVEGRVIYNPDARDPKEKARVDWTTPIKPLGEGQG